MTIPESLKLKNTIKYPTSIIIGGLNRLGLEITDSLIKQGGYVILVDNVTPDNLDKLKVFTPDTLLSFVDYTAIPHLDDDIRRLDYVFYFAHESIDFRAEVSTQEFLTFSNYLDAILSLATKFEARFLLTTSIKAYQILTNESVLGNTSGSKYTPVYTDMEIQRYAEGLTLEYHEKVELNSRIVRLGEIIGEGMDFSNNTAFVKLIMNAVKGEPLLLQNDGLENEWYIHMLDAAYGIIKAQFTKGTEGKVFSLCYDNVYTHLSVAYRIQEIQEDVREIKFVQGDAKSTISVRTHKPAPNLSKVGWMPRIQFDRAVAQSVSAAKIFMLEHGIENTEEVEIKTQAKKKVSVVDKLKSFLSLADTKDIVVQDQSPVTKLVAKKKNEVSLKKQKLTTAGAVIKLKRTQRKRGRLEKMVNAFWKTFARLGTTFTFLKRLSPAELAVLTFFLITLGLAFFMIISPVLVIGRNLVAINSDLKTLDQAINTFNSKNTNVLSKRIVNYINELERSYSTLRPIASLITLGDELETIAFLTSSYKEVLEGFVNISFATEPTRDYLAQLVNNTQLRNTTSTYLSTINPGLNYSTNLNDAESRVSFIDSGIKKIERGLDKINTTNVTDLPSFAEEYLNNLKKQFNLLSNIRSNAEINAYIPSMLGKGRPNNFVLLLLDNSRPAPIGGDIAAFANARVLNGSIQEITVLSLSQANFNMKSIDQNDLDLINSNRFINKTIADVTITDLSSLTDLAEFSAIAKDIWIDSFNFAPDTFITINLNAAENLSKLISQSDLIEIKGVNFSNGSLLNNIAATILGSENLNDRKDTLAQLLSHLIHKSINHLITNPADVLRLLQQEIDSGNIGIYADQNKFQRYVKNNNLDFSGIKKSQNFVDLSYAIYDPKVTNTTRFSNISFDLDSFVRSDLNIQNTISITFPNLGTTQEVSVCLPNNTIISSVVPDNNLIPSLRTAIKTKAEKICAVFQSVSETQARLTWVNNTGLTEKNTEINFGIGLAGGAINSGDIQISGEQSVQLNFDNTVFASGPNTGIFSGTLEKDLIEKIIFTKISQ